MINRQEYVQGLEQMADYHNQTLKNFLNSQVRLKAIQQTDKSVNHEMDSIRNQITNKEKYRDFLKGILKKESAYES